MEHYQRKLSKIKIKTSLKVWKICTKIVRTIEKYLSKQNIIKIIIKIQIT